MKTFLALISLAALSLSGCVFTETPTEFAGGTGLAMDTKQNEISACLQWMERQEAADRERIDRLPANEKAMAVMHHDTMDMIKNVWGKESNVCKPGTNQWDAYIAYVKETEKSHRQYSKDLKTVATLGVVTTGAVRLADSIMGAAGDKINASGDGSQVTKTEDNDKTVSIANDKSQATATGTAETGGSGKAESAGEAISATALADCGSTSAGAASVDEMNSCLSQDYGYATSVQNGVIYYNGKPL